VHIKCIWNYCTFSNKHQQSSSETVCVHAPDFTIYASHSHIKKPAQFLHIEVLLLFAKVRFDRPGYIFAIVIRMPRIDAQFRPYGKFARLPASAPTSAPLPSHFPPHPPFSGITLRKSGRSLFVRSIKEKSEKVSLEI